MGKESLLGEDVFTVSGFFQPEECEAFIEASERRGYEEAPVGAGDVAVVMKEYRSNDRILIDDTALASKLFRRIKPWLPPEIASRPVLGLNERFRFYRYDAGQTFAPHYDYPFVRSEAEASALTLMIYLNDDFEGGTTDFYHEDHSLRLRVRPEQGMALIFRHDLFHAGTPVTAGRKYVLRTDVMYGGVRWAL